jgi:hypothetical protein
VSEYRITNSFFLGVLYRENFMEKKKETCNSRRETVRK